MKKSKVCAKCGCRRKIDKFNKQTASPDGHGAWCRKCSLAYAKKYNKSHKVEQNAWYMEHRAEILAKYHANKTCDDRKGCIRVT